MSQARTLVLIPARFQSSRFPGKPLAEISGKSMIRHVYENLSANGLEVAVVTDNDKIESHVKEFGKVLRVDDDVPSGTQRINLAYERYFEEGSFDIIVNVQGDEPLIKVEDILKLIDFHSNHNFEISTLIKEQDDQSEFVNPNRVKAVWSEESGECHYFSRSPVPHARDDENKSWLLHIGVYCFNASSLKKMCNLKESNLEKLECLEQLRAIEAGMKIGAIKTDSVLLGVDVPEDIKKVEGVLSGQ